MRSGSAPDPVSILVARAEVDTALKYIQHNHPAHSLTDALCVISATGRELAPRVRADQPAGAAARVLAAAGPAKPCRLLRRLSGRNAPGVPLRLGSGIQPSCQNVTVQTPTCVQPSTVCLLVGRSHCLHRCGWSLRDDLRCVVLAAAAQTRRRAAAGRRRTCRHVAAVTAAPWCGAVMLLLAWCMADGAEDAAFQLTCRSLAVLRLQRALRSENQPPRQLWVSPTSTWCEA